MLSPAQYTHDRRHGRVCCPAVVTPDPVAERHPLAARMSAEEVRP